MAELNMSAAAQWFEIPLKELRTLLYSDEEFPRGTFRNEVDGPLWDDETLEEYLASVGTINENWKDSE